MKMKKSCFLFLLQRKLRMATLMIIFFSVNQLSAQRLPYLKLSDDRKYIETQEGKPFFWLGDTAWELVHRLDREEVTEYFRNRKEKGFNVVQTVILAEMNGLHTPNAYGNKPLFNDDPSRLNEKYFEHLDFVLIEAEKYGLYVGLLPTWGDKFNKKWGVGPEIFTPEKAENFGELLGKRYKNYPNIIWILGGDRIPENDLHYKIINGIARGIQKEDRSHLISYHPSGAKIASDYIDESWLDIDMYQSGHSSLAKEYKYPEKSEGKKYKRPVINGEARYEDIFDRFWENQDFGRLDDTDVRVSAYWSLLAGAAGYTYGNNDIWQMYSGEGIPVLDARLGWKKAMDLPGAYQMQYMEEFFTSLEWQDLESTQEFIKSSNPEDSGYIVAAKTEEIALFYSPEGRSFLVNFQVSGMEKQKAFWFDPRKGTYEKQENPGKSGPFFFVPPTSGEGQDWLLLVFFEDRNLNKN